MESVISHLNICEDGTTETADTSAGFKPTEPQATAPTPKNASLDGLPAELKISILRSTPNIHALQTLVRSSPLYHKVYLHERKAILSEVLLRDIGTEVLPDALAVHKAFQIGFDNPSGRKDSVESFISQYRAGRGSYSLAAYDSLDIQTFESLSRLQSIVSEIAFDFCNKVLSVHPVTGERIQSHGDISPNEKRRIYRALYRFELFRALFSRSLDIFDWMDQSFLFLSIFKVWEVEELASVRDYIIRRHTEILQECSSELSKLRPRKDLNDEIWQAQNTGFLISLGLPFLCRLLNASSNAQKASILKYNLSWDAGFLTPALNEEPYDLVYVTGMYTAAEDGQELLFQDDILVDSPNAAWPWSTHHKVSLFYFEGYKKPLRKWAYVMWDLDRLEDWKILELDMNQICGRDP